MVQLLSEGKKDTKLMKQMKQGKASSTAKKSIIAGGLIGTGGFLIAKAIGLVYSIPFSSILGSDAYMSYYGSAYRIYSYMLNVFTAGAPMAIATMVAKYVTRNNFKTVLRVRQMSLLVMGFLGFAGMLAMFALSGVLAGVMSEGTEEGRAIMATALKLLSIAIFFVPLLSAYRGFIQGCKEMEEYAFSQAYEQIFRVAFLLGLSCLLVYGFHMSSVYALYVGVLSTSVAAFVAIFQISRFSKASAADLKKASRRQRVKAVALQPLFREFILLCIPYLLFAIIGYANDIYDAVLLPLGLKHSSYTMEQIQTMTSAANYVGIKLTAIPMILSPGFVAAIIPHITSALETKNYKVVRKDILECVNIVLFIALFLSFAIFWYAKPLFFTLYYTDDLNLAATSVRWIAIEGFFGTITPVISSMMMACRLRKRLLVQMGISAVIKGVLMVPMVMWWGIAGATISTVISYAWIIYYSLREMGWMYDVSFRSTLKVLIQTSLCLIAMALCAFLLTKIGLGNTSAGRTLCLIGMLVNGVLSSLVFMVCAFYFGIPQRLFHFRLRSRRRR